MTHATATQIAADYVNALVEEHGTNKAVAKILKVSAPRVSELRNGKASQVLTAKVADRAEAAAAPAGETVHRVKRHLDALMKDCIADFGTHFLDASAVQGRTQFVWSEVRDWCISRGWAGDKKDAADLALRVIRVYERQGDAVFTSDKSERPQVMTVNTELAEHDANAGKLRRLF